MKTWLIGSFTVLALLALPAHGQEFAQRIVQSGERYEATGNFLWATKQFSFTGTGSGPIFVTVTAKCPKGYVAVAGGYKWTDRASGAYAAPITETRATDNHSGWTIGIAIPAGDGVQYQGEATATCALPSNAFYRR